MKQIDFHFNVNDRSIYACRLVKKVTGMGLRVALWSSDHTFLTRVYEDLWRFEDLTFIAHAWAGTDYEKACSVCFGDQLEALPSSDVLVLLDEAVPADWQKAFSRFDRVVDIVGRNETELQHSRARYRIYKASGVELKAYDRSAT